MAKVIPAELLSFGAEVKRLRQASGLSQQALSELVNVTRGYIGQVESGTTRCRADFAERLDVALNANGRLVDSWDELLDRIKLTKYPKYFASYPKAEDSAVMLRGYEERLVHGLFQTEDYARALLLNEESVKSRMRRQEILARAQPPALSVVMDDSVLHRQIGSSEVMRAQLQGLLELSERPNITIQILPVVHVRSLWGTFTIATARSNDQVVYTDKAYGGETSTNDEDIAFVNEVFARLQAEALNTRDSRMLMRKVLEEKWT